MAYSGEYPRWNIGASSRVTNPNPLVYGNENASQWRREQYPSSDNGRSVGYSGYDPYRQHSNKGTAWTPGGPFPGVLLGSHQNNGSMQWSLPSSPPLLTPQVQHHNSRSILGLSAMLPPARTLLTPHSEPIHRTSIYGLLPIPQRASSAQHYASPVPTGPQSSRSTPSRSPRADSTGGTVLLPRYQNRQNEGFYSPLKTSHAGGRPGGPPKAVLGGPGGMTYEELKRSEAFSLTPVVKSLDTPPRTMSAKGTFGEEWDHSANVRRNSSPTPTVERRRQNRVVTIKLPPDEYDPPVATTSGPSPLESGEEGVVDDSGESRTFAWPKRAVAVLPWKIPLPLSVPTSPELEASTGMEAFSRSQIPDSGIVDGKPKWKGKEIEVVVPDRTCWSVLFEEAAGRISERLAAPQADLNPQNDGEQGGDRETTEDEENEIIDGQDELPSKAWDEVSSSDEGSDPLFRLTSPLRLPPLDNPTAEAVGTSTMDPKDLPLPRSPIETERSVSEIQRSSQGEDLPASTDTSLAISARRGRRLVFGNTSFLRRQLGEALNTSTAIAGGRIAKRTGDIRPHHEAGEMVPPAGSNEAEKQIIDKESSEVHLDKEPDSAIFEDVPLTATSDPSSPLGMFGIPLSVGREPLFPKEDANTHVLPAHEPRRPEITREIGEYVTKRRRTSGTGETGPETDLSHLSRKQTSVDITAQSSAPGSRFTPYLQRQLGSFLKRPEATFSLGEETSNSIRTSTSSIEEQDKVAGGSEKESSNTTLLRAVVSQDPVVIETPEALNSEAVFTATEDSSIPLPKKRLRPSANPWVPSHHSSGSASLDKSLVFTPTVSVFTMDRSPSAQALRPTAQPWMPGHPVRSGSNVSDTGPHSSSKRLRPDAEPFRSPSGIRIISTTMIPAASNKPSRTSSSGANTPQDITTLRATAPVFKPTGIFGSGTAYSFVFSLINERSIFDPGKTVLEKTGDAATTVYAADDGPPSVEKTKTPTKEATSSSLLERSQREAHTSARPPVYAGQQSPEESTYLETRTSPRSLTADPTEADEEHPVSVQLASPAGGVSAHTIDDDMRIALGSIGDSPAGMRPIPPLDIPELPSPSFGLKGRDRDVKQRLWARRGTTTFGGRTRSEPGGSDLIEAEQLDVEHDKFQPGEVEDRSVDLTNLFFRGPSLSDGDGAIVAWRKAASPRPPLTGDDRWPTGHDDYDDTASIGNEAESDRSYRLQRRTAVRRAQNSHMSRSIARQISTRSSPGSPTRSVDQIKLQKSQPIHVRRGAAFGVGTGKTDEDQNGSPDAPHLLKSHLPFDSFGVVSSVTQDGRHHAATAHSTPTRLTEECQLVRPLPPMFHGRTISTVSGRVSDENSFSAAQPLSFDEETSSHPFTAGLAQLGRGVDLDRSGHPGESVSTSPHGGELRSLPPDHRTSRLWQDIPETDRLCLLSNQRLWDGSTVPISVSRSSAYDDQRMEAEDLEYGPFWSGGGEIEEAQHDFGVTPQIRLRPADDVWRFRQWVFPLSDEKWGHIPRPSMSRRHTMPHERASFTTETGRRQSDKDFASWKSDTGIATSDNAPRNLFPTFLAQSTRSPEMLHSNAVDENDILGINDNMRSNRTSAEFPMRKDSQKRLVLVDPEVEYLSPDQGQPSQCSDHSSTFNLEPVLSNAIDGGVPSVSPEALVRVIESNSATLTDLLSGVKRNEANLRATMEAILQEVRAAIQDSMSSRGDDAKDQTASLLLKVTDVLEEHSDLLRKLHVSEQEDEVRHNNATEEDGSNAEDMFRALLTGQHAILDKFVEVAEVDAEARQELERAVEALNTAKEDAQLHSTADKALIMELRRQLDEEETARQSAERKKAELEEQVKLIARGREDALNDAQLSRETLEKFGEELIGLQSALAESRSDKDTLMGEKSAAISALEEMKISAERESSALEAVKVELEAERRKYDQAEEAQRKLSVELVEMKRSFDDQILKRFADVEQALVRMEDGQREDRERSEERERKLREELTTTKKTLDASLIELAQLRASSSAVLSSALQEQGALREQLDRERSAKADAETRTATLLSGMESTREECTNWKMIASQRESWARMSEIRLQALTYENGYWRQFALEADRRRYKSFMATQPFQSLDPAKTERKGHERVSSSVLSQQLETPPQVSQNLQGGPSRTTSLDTSESLGNDAAGAKSVFTNGTDEEGSWWVVDSTGNLERK